MSSPIPPENTRIPLVGLNGTPNYTDTTTVAATEDVEHGPGRKRKIYKYENVGVRLARRKELFRKRRNISDVAFVTALVGIVLMLIHTELYIGLGRPEADPKAALASNETASPEAGGYYTNKSPGAIVLKILISLSTVDLLGMLIWYHVVNLKLYMIDNGMEDKLLALSYKNAFLIVLELIVCAIHPIPGDINFHWIEHDFVSETSESMTVPLDILLSIPMFLRLYLLCRVMLLHSSLFADARSQSLGALNKTKFNFYFIFKSLMYLHPVYVMVVIVISIFLIGSWALRFCEVNHDVLHYSYFNSLWLVAITFLSVGYGDVVPHTYCGRTIAVSVGLLGASWTALVVAVLAQKLELSRAEKYVHNFVIDCELDKKLKTSAANILKYGWRVYRGKKRGESEGSIRSNHRKLLKAINQIRKTKQEQRKMVDSQVTVLEVYKNQTFISDSVESIITKQEDLEESVETMKNQVNHIGNKLDELCRIMAARKDRRETKKAVASHEHDPQPDLFK